MGSGASDLVTGGDTTLVETYLERRADLLRFFTGRLKSAAAAEDLVQDIYLRLKGLDPGVEVTNPAGYLYRLGSNLMLDRLRGERRAAQREADWRDSHRTSLAGEDVAEEPAADEALAARQRLALIVQALEALSPQTQRVFRMHKFEGMSHAEVAQALGVSRSAVEKHMIAALRHLTARLP
jgi:RNA polymerase sigma-70 factor (ECF subfamily)